VANNNLSILFCPKEPMMRKYWVWNNATKNYMQTDETIIIIYSSHKCSFPDEFGFDAPFSPWVILKFNICIYLTFFHKFWVFTSRSVPVLPQGIQEFSISILIELLGTANSFVSEKSCSQIDNIFLYLFFLFIIFTRSQLFSSSTRLFSDKWVLVRTFMYKNI
jgi:hypothetical protein